MQGKEAVAFPDAVLRPADGDAVGGGSDPAATVAEPRAQVRRRAKSRPLATVAVRDPVAVAATPSPSPTPSSSAARPVSARTATGEARRLHPRTSAGASTGSVATIEVPRPGVGADHERPVRQLDAFPHRGESHPSLSEELPGHRAVEPSAVVLDLDAERRGGRLDRDDHATGAGVLRRVGERLLHHPIRERLEVGGHRAGERAHEVGLDALLDPEARHRLAERGHQPALLEDRRTQSRHQCAQRVRLVGQLLADLREHVDAAVDVARADHEERRFERERRGRDALHRPVVEVARDPVPLGLDRGVRPPEEAGAVLVLLLEELQQRADRLVGGLARA